MSYDCYGSRTDYGPNPHVGNIGQMALKNQNFRTAVWTGEYLQMTVMCIPPCGEIGLEVHETTDQFIRVEQGKGIVQIGSSECRQEYQRELCQGEAIFVPAGTWHNIKNLEQYPLKVSSVYAPPNHKRGTVHRTKAEAEREERY